MRAALTKAPKLAGPAPLYARLHSGPHGPGHDSVASNQRSRLVGAMIEEVAERGYPAATLARLVALAGVSKRAFHELFGTKEAYFLATYDAIIERAVERISAAYRSEGPWRARLRAAFDAYAAEVVAQPKAAQLALVGVLGAGPSALKRMESTRQIFEDMITQSFAAAPEPIALPPTIVKGIVCGIERVTRQRLAGDIAELPALADELLDWALSYRSVAAAQLADPSLEQPRRPAPRNSRAAEGENEPLRILRATARLAARAGYSHLTPGQIIDEAEVSEETFGKRTVESCFLAALDLLALEALKSATRASSQIDDDPLASLHRGIVALLRHIADDPVLMRVAFVEVFALPDAVEHREALLHNFNDLLMQRLPQPLHPSSVTVEASVGAIWGIVHHHIARHQQNGGAAHRLPGLADYATYLALAPAAGGEAAVQAILAGPAEASLAVEAPGK
jgi:AcrR family transcriptional regulator